MHECGPCTISNSKLISYNKEVICNPAILLDVCDNTVVLLKYGEQDFINDYYNSMVNGYLELGCSSFIEHLTIINLSDALQFNVIADKGLLTLDEVCTIINWLSNHPSEKVIKEKLGDGCTIHDNLKQLSLLGF